MVTRLALRFWSLASIISLALLCLLFTAQVPAQLPNFGSIFPGANSNTNSNTATNTNGSSGGLADIINNISTGISNGLNNSGSTSNGSTTGSTTTGSTIFDNIFNGITNGLTNATNTPTNPGSTTTPTTTPSTALTFTAMTATFTLTRLTDRVAGLSATTQNQYDFCDLSYSSLPTTSITADYSNTNTILANKKYVTIETMKKVTPTTYQIPILPLLTSDTQTMVLFYQLLCGNNQSTATSGANSKNVVHFSPLQKYAITTATDIPPVIRLNSTQFNVDTTNQLNGLVTPSQTQPPFTSGTTIVSTPTPSSLTLNNISATRATPPASFNSLTPPTSNSTASKIQEGYDIYLYALNTNTATITAASLTVIINDVELHTISMAKSQNVWSARSIPFSSKDYVYFRFIYTSSANSSQLTSAWFSWSESRSIADQVPLPINTINPNTGNTTSTAPSAACSSCISSCPTNATPEVTKTCWTKCCPNEEQNVVDWLNSVITLNPSTSNSLFPPSSGSNGSSGTNTPSTGLPGLPDLSQLFPTLSYSGNSNNANLHAQFNTLPKNTFGVSNYNFLMNTFQLPGTPPSIPSTTNPFPTVQPNLPTNTPPTTSLPTPLPTTTPTPTPTPTPTDTGLPSLTPPAPTDLPTPTPSLPNIPGIPQGSSSFLSPTLPPGLSSPFSTQSLLNDISLAQPTLNLNGLFPNLISNPSTTPSQLVIPMVGSSTISVPTTPPSTLQSNPVTATPLQLHTTNPQFKTAQLDSTLLSGLTSTAGSTTGSTGAASGITNGITSLLDPSAINDTAASLPTKVKETTCLEATCLSQCLSTGQPLFDTMQTGMAQMVADGITPPAPTAQQLSAVPSLPTGAVSMPTPGSGFAPPMPSASMIPDFSAPQAPKQPTSGIFSVAPEMVQQMPMDQLKPIVQQQFNGVMGNITNISTGSSNMLNCVNACQASCKAGQTVEVDCTGEKKNSLECMAQTMDNWGNTSTQLGETITTITNGAQSALDSVNGVLPFNNMNTLNIFNIFTNKYVQNVANDEEVGLSATNSFNTFNIKQIFRTMQLATTTATTTTTTTVKPTTTSTTTATPPAVVQFTSFDDIFSRTSPTTPSTPGNASSSPSDVDFAARAAYLQQLLAASTTASQLATPITSVNRNTAIAVINPSSPDFAAIGTQDQALKNFGNVFLALPENLQPAPSLALQDKLVGLSNLSARR